MSQQSQSVNTGRTTISLLTSSFILDAGQARMLRRLAEHFDAKLDWALVLGNEPADTVERKPPGRPASVRDFLNRVVLLAEWRFLSLLPERFSGLGWRGRAISIGEVPVRQLFDRVIDFEPEHSTRTGFSGEAQWPERQSKGKSIIVTTDAALRTRVLKRLPGFSWIAINIAAESDDLRFAGFSSVLRGHDTTDFSISVWPASTEDGGRRLVGRNRTKLLYVLNQAAIWDRIGSCLISLVTQWQLSDSGDARLNVGPKTPSGRMAEDLLPPSSTRFGTKHLFAYIGVAGWRMGRVLIGQVCGKRTWSLLIAKGNPIDGQLAEPRRLVADQGFFWADPMLYRPPGGRLHCFVEEFDFSKGKAAIAVLAEDGSGDWHRLGLALAQPFHLSFPFLFEHDGHLFMCPEAYLSDQITVYRCTDFPLQWEVAETIMDGVSAADTMVVEANERWWLITNLDNADAPDHQAELHLFYADSPLSRDWKAVSWNPIKVDAKGGRNGGFFKIGGDLFRCGQCHSIEAYGKELAIYRVTRLEPNAFEESLVRKFRLPDSIPGNGTHTLSLIGDQFAIDVLGK